jgi:RNA polymerase sigma-70 factor (ECF subfamily)
MSVRPSTAELHARLATDLRAWFARRAPADRVDDLVQDTFLKVHTGLGGLKDPERVGAWVFTVARRTLADHHRGQPDTISPDDAPDTALAVDASDPFPDPSLVLATWLRATIDDLPDKYREALHLTELEGLSQAELAERLGLSPSGARTRVQRGRRMLLARLESCCHIERDGADIIEWRPHEPGCGGCG